MLFRSNRELRKAAQILEDRFGLKAPGLTSDAIAAVIRIELCAATAMVERVHSDLDRLSLPGGEVIAQAASLLGAMRTGSERTRNFAIESAMSLTSTRSAPTPSFGL